MVEKTRKSVDEETKTLKEEIKSLLSNASFNNSLTSINNSPIIRGFEEAVDFYLKVFSKEETIQRLRELRNYLKSKDPGRLLNEDFELLKTSTAGMNDQKFKEHFETEKRASYMSDLFWKMLFASYLINDKIVNIYQDILGGNLPHFSLNVEEKQEPRAAGSVNPDYPGVISLYLLGDYMLVIKVLTHEYIHVLQNTKYLNSWEEAKLGGIPSAKEFEAEALSIISTYLCLEDNDRERFKKYIERALKERGDNEIKEIDKVINRSEREAMLESYFAGMEVAYKIIRSLGDDEKIKEFIRAIYITGKDDGKNPILELYNIYNGSYELGLHGFLRK